MSKIVDLQQWREQNEAIQNQESKLFLSEKEVRSFPKFKDASDEEVQNIIVTLHSLALLSYQAFCMDENYTVSKVA